MVCVRAVRKTRNYLLAYLDSEKRVDFPAEGNLIVEGDAQSVHV